MKEYSLTGTKRAAAGKRAAKHLRAEGLIPCNLISKDGALSFTVKAVDLRKLLYTSNVYAINLDIEGTACKAILKEAQFGPVNEEILHLDFQKFNPEDDIVVAIPVKVEGHAAGVKAGGKLVKQVNTLTVKGNYANIPDRLVVDVTSLELGKSLCVGDLKFENLELLNAKSVIVASVKATRASRGK
jgi:large subunit ribosomal protein L25